MIRFFLLCSAGCLLLASGSYADTIIMREGKELKGIVVEDYQDRIVFSSADGEITVMKADIRELSFDSEEDNLIKLAEQSRDRKDYARSFAYYDRALKLNPKSKLAQDGVVFLQGYLFRKEQVQKEDEVKKQEAIENFGADVEESPGAEERMRGLSDALKNNLGITIKMENEMPVVENLRLKSPAYEAGIKRGDRLAAVWGRLTGYLSLEEAMNMLLDKPSLELKITVERTLHVRLNPGNSINADFSMEFDGLTVSDVKQEGAAFNAGLKKGDLVTIIDRKSTRYMPLKKALELIKHSHTGYVELVIRREILIWRKD